MPELLVGGLQEGAHLLHTMGLTQQEAARTRLLGTEQQLQQVQLQNVQREQQALQQMGQGGGAAEQGGQPPSMADRADQFAGLLMSAGAPGAAMKYATQAATIRQHQATQMNQQVHQQLAQFEMQHKKANDLGGFLAGVEDSPAGLVKANAAYALTHGEASPLEGVPWTPGLIKAATRGAMTVAEQQKLDAAKLVEQHKEALRKSTIAQQSTHINLMGQQSALVKERIDLLKKNGGVTPEVAALRQQRTELVKAQTQATQERAAREQAKVAGKSPETALPVPASQAALVKGQHYKNPQGAVALWTGTGFAPVSTAPAKTVPIPTSQEDDDE